MPTTSDNAPTAEEVLQELCAFIDAAAEGLEPGAPPLKPDHRIPFHWPPHPVSHGFHVLAGDWKERATWSAYGETFPVTVARTPHGIFGRCDVLWHEARGETMEEMLANLETTAAPLFERQFAISKTLGLEGRFGGHIRDLGPVDLVKLLYCPDRDVANEARTEIETHASLNVFTPALIEVLKDTRHPHRRSAQWCVLDLFEDLPSFCTNPTQENEAVAAMKELLWSSQDDYARTIYKAGVVLGGHLPDEEGEFALLDCLRAKSKYGRRSAMHGLFHVVEWHPGERERVVSALRAAAAVEPEPLLKTFASHMADDIEAQRFEHVEEPIFDEER
ncbi:MAG: hypothetical protein H6534_07745 [Chthonomonadaceae bacterium]|nr:hypothetical protein [Chthonomonadaceae bacterium]